MASHTLSPISSRSPSVSVMGPSGGLVTFDLFRCPSFYCSLYFLTHNGVFFPSSPPPPCADCSSSSIWGEWDLPLHSESRCSCSTCFFVACSFSNQAFSSASFLHYTTNFWTAYFTSSFFFSTKLPAPLLVPMARSDGQWKSTGHHLMT